MTLTRGDDSRLDGAPGLSLPNYADRLEAVATMLFAQDPAKYGGEKENAREDAIAYIKNEEAMKQEQARQERAAGESRVAERAAARQARMGVDPDSLPYQTSARDIQEANRPLPEAEAALEMEQEAAADIIRGSREGKRDWEAEGDLAYLRERGERNPLAAPGQRDLDLRRRWMEGRGRFYEMPDGTRIPVGRDPTAAELRGLEEFDDWTNETPGTERQALYNPEGYEEFREGVRQDIQDRARQQLVDYGEGPDSNPALTADQQTNRAARAESENRVYNNPWEVRRRRQRLAMRAGATPSQAAEDIASQYEAEGRPLSFEDRLRMQGDLAGMQDQRVRRGRVAQQAAFAGGQPTGGPFGTRATTTAINQLGPGWREIAILNRLTGREYGPTPLGVEAMGAQNAFRMMQGMELGQGFLNNPAVQQQVQNAQLQQQANVLADAEEHVNTNYAWDRGWPGASSFTTAEQQNTVRYLMNKYGPPAGRMTLAQAQAIVDDIAARKGAEPAVPPPPLGDFGAPPMM